MPPQISVIVIARDEEVLLPRLLHRLKMIPHIIEIVLADGGSRDQTAQIARDAGAHVVFAQGRGAQLNAGAAVASGDILWFLHADALPARGCTSQMMRALGRGAVGGHFRVHFESHRKSARFFELVARIQAKFGVFYGDSGLWAERTAFDAIGGFENWPLFEDVQFARNLKKTGHVATCPGRLFASARRFEKRPWKTLLLWLELQIRFDLGQSPDELAHIYRGRG